ncbi:MAG: TrmH family RNA methyltransferase [Chloroflexota bacterium]
MEIISSRNNPKIKEARILKNAKYRRQSGLCLVEGIWHFIEAVEAWRQGGYATLIHVFYSPDLLTSELARKIIQEVETAGIPCYAVTADVFSSMAEKEHPQGVLAVVRPKVVKLDQLEADKHDWLVGLVEPQDPGNIGSIMRTMDAVGAKGLLLIDRGAEAFHPEAIRASMGAGFWMPVIQTSFEEMIHWAAMNDYRIYGTSAHGTREVGAIHFYQKPCILLMGSERQGLSQPQRAACHELIRLPMVGRVSSLNLAVATGIMLYDMLAKMDSAHGSI